MQTSNFIQPDSPTDGFGEFSNFFIIAAIKNTSIWLHEAVCKYILIQFNLSSQRDKVQNTKVFVMNL